MRNLLVELFFFATPVQLELERKQLKAFDQQASLKMMAEQAMQRSAAGKGTALVVSCAKEEKEERKVVVAEEEEKQLASILSVNSGRSRRKR